MELRYLNVLGALISIIILVLCSLIFIFRLYGLSKLEHWLGFVFILCSIPIIYLLLKSHGLQRPSIYLVQLSLMLFFILVELMLDYVLKVEFRNIRWIVITYAIIFFASTGGMIGVASNAGKIWTIIAVGLFFFMTGMAFLQRAKTGM